MNCFYSDDKVGNAVRLNEEDAQHALKSLRLRDGANIVLVVNGKRYAALLEVRGREVWANLTVELPGTEARTRITLYQGLVKGDKMDDIIRQCTEAGVHKIVPCLFARSVARPKADQMQPRLQRWRKIAREAAMQSGRTMIPEVGGLLTFAGMTTELEKHRQALVPWEEATAKACPRAYDGSRDIAVVIGPRAAWSRMNYADEGNARDAGPRILRDTAGVVAIAALLAPGTCATQRRVMPTVVSHLGLQGKPVRQPGHAGAVCTGRHAARVSGHGRCICHQHLCRDRWAKEKPEALGRAQRKPAG